MPFFGAGGNTNLINITSTNSYLESFTVFSQTIFRQCLTFDAVYMVFTVYLVYTCTFVTYSVL